MDTVKKDLREKIAVLEKTDKEKKKSEDVETISAERDYFRMEAIRLNEYSRDLSQVNDDLLRENKIKAMEIKSLTKKWKDSEASNRQLLEELEKNLKLISNLENEKKRFIKFQIKTDENEYSNTTNNSNYNKNTKYKTFNFNNNTNNNFNSTLIGTYNNSISVPNFNNLYNSFEGSNQNNKNSFNNSELNDYQLKKINVNNSNLSLNKESNSNEKYNNLNSNRSFNNIILNNSSTYNMNNNSTDDIENPTNNNIYNNLNSETLKDKDKIIKIIEKLKEELKKEKNKNQKIICDFNKIILDKKKMEKIFMDCVEESRREILQRKLRDTVHTTKSGFFKSFGKKSGLNLPAINDIKYENFQPSDKRKLVENFLMREEIINFIKENLVNINSAENKLSYLQKNNFNETILNYKQALNNKTLNETKIFTMNEFTKSKNTLRSTKNFDYQK